MTTRRRRRPARKGMAFPAFLRLVGLGVCLMFLAAGNLPSLTLVGSVLLFSYRPARRAVLILAALAGLIGIFLLVWAAYRRTHAGPWGRLSDDRAPWRQYLADAPPPRRPAQRYATRKLPAPRPPTPRDPWSAPTVRLGRPVTR